MGTQVVLWMAIVALESGDVCICIKYQHNMIHNTEGSHSSDMRVGGCE